MSLLVRFSRSAGLCLEGTRRGDGAGRVVRALGWRWGRSVGSWYLPGSRGRFVDAAALQLAMSALTVAGFDVVAEIDDSVGDVDRELRERAQREAGRADRLRRRAAKHEAAAADHAASYESLVEMNPPGQPYLVDAAGYGRQLRAAAARDRHEALAIEHERAAREDQAAAQRAQESHVSRHSPAAVAGRVVRLGQQLRRIRRVLAQDDGTGPARAQLVAQEQRVGAELTYWEQVQAQLLADGALDVWGPTRVQVGDEVQVGAQWWPVVRVNRASVTVRTATGTQRAPWRSVRDRRSAS